MTLTFDSIKRLLINFWSCSASWCQWCPSHHHQQLQSCLCIHLCCSSCYWRISWIIFDCDCSPIWSSWYSFFMIDGYQALNRTTVCASIDHLKQPVFHLLSRSLLFECEYSLCFLYLYWQESYLWTENRLHLFLLLYFETHGNFSILWCFLQRNSKNQAK